MSAPRSPFHDLEFPAPERIVPLRRSMPEVEEPEFDPEPGPVNLRTPVLLFLATAVSVFLTGAVGVPSGEPEGWGGFAHALLGGWTFAVPLLAILLFHEFGHYIAARLHRVDASLPYFIPLPFLSPFGTMGAVIQMRGRIRSRNALLDIGASGPLAGLVVAIPVLAIGLSLSEVGPTPEGHYWQEGQSLLYMAMKRVILGPIPVGHDVMLHPTAFAGFAGLLVTMMNLVPWGQLDGGHVAYALLGARQNRYARVFRALLIPMFLYNLGIFLVPVLLHQSSLSAWQAVSNSLFWLMWYAVLGVIGRLSGGSAHPPTEPGDLSPIRRVVAIVTLGFFVLLFMPSPLTAY
jgi:membrane-associated protease RseP (regulator of RpoE activity)